MATAKEAAARAHLFIAEWMRATGMTDEKLAELLQTSRVTVWRWRTEQHRLNPEKIVAIADAMGICPEDLWRPPGRPSLDAILKGAPDETVRRMADVVAILAKREQ